MGWGGGGGGGGITKLINFHGEILNVQLLFGIPIMTLRQKMWRKYRRWRPGQRWACRQWRNWACRQWRNTSSVNDMLDELEWPSQEDRRLKSSLTFFYKIHSGTVSPDKDTYMTQDIPGSDLI